MAVIIGNMMNGNPVFGGMPDLPVSVPVGVSWWKIRQRAGSLAVIYLRRDDRFEKWVLTEKDGKLIPGYKQGENRSQKASKNV